MAGPLRRRDHLKVVGELLVEEPALLVGQRHDNRPHDERNADQADQAEQGMPGHGGEQPADEQGRNAQ